MSALVRDILSDPPGGPVAAVLGDGYEPRPEQLEMAAAVARALEARSHLLVEAGTGVGKSFAYLVPAIERAVMRKETVVIATNTISLQEQLVQKDIPLLQDALRLPPPPDPDAQQTLPREPDPRAAEKPFGILREGVPLNPVLVKGRGNYVSIRRLQMASQRQDRLLADAPSRRSLHVIEDWAFQTLDGTLSTLPPLERPAVWDRVQSDSGNCMGRKCPQYSRCFYQKARRRMERANLLICNHALFFSDLALRQQEVGFLPEYQHVILDEAHNVEDVAAEHFGISLSEGRVMHLLGLLYNARSGKGYLTQLEAGAIRDQDEVDRAVRLVLHAENESRAFFESLVRAFRSGKARGGRIREPGIVENTLSPAMAELSLRLGALRELLPPEEKRTEPDRYELNAYALRATGIAAEARTLVEQSMEGCAYWVEVSGEEERRMGPKVTLACSPIEVGPLLKERLFGTGKSVILTSATLADGATKRAPSVSEGSPASAAGRSPFSHIQSRLGCENAEALILGSPFEYARQMELHVERSMPRPESSRPPPRPAPARDEYDQRTPLDDDRATGVPPSSAGTRAATPPARSAPARYHGQAEGGLPMPPAPTSYNDLLTSRILHHLHETGGGAFVLFTSFATLRAVADRLTAPLVQRDMPLLVQGRDGPRSLLLQRFRENPRSVLLGAASFWQGVDVRGEALRNVIITRLPFEPPDRPLTEARLERIQQRGGDPFLEDSLPRAVIRFKQGFGRLIRSRTDRGRVVVLDPRILTTGYGRRFLDALPPGVRILQS